MKKIITILLLLISSTVFAVNAPDSASIGRNNPWKCSVSKIGMSSQANASKEYLYVYLSGLDGKTAVVMIEKAWNGGSYKNISAQLLLAKTMGSIVSIYFLKPQDSTFDGHGSFVYTDSGVFEFVIE